MASSFPEGLGEGVASSFPEGLGEGVASSFPEGLGEGIAAGNKDMTWVRSGRRSWRDKGRGETEQKRSKMVVEGEARVVCVEGGQRVVCVEGVVCT